MKQSWESTMGKHALRMVTVASALALCACAEQVPPQVATYGYFPAYERGIDQDIAASHEAGSATLDNSIPGRAAPWRLQQNE
jgi:hypothetical protein